MMDLCVYKAGIDDHDRLYGEISDGTIREGNQDWPSPIPRY